MSVQALTQINQDLIIPHIELGYFPVYHAVRKSKHGPYLQLTYAKLKILLGNYIVFLETPVEYGTPNYRYYVYQTDIYERVENGEDLPPIEEGGLTKYLPRALRKLILEVLPRYGADVSILLMLSEIWEDPFILFKYYDLYGGSRDNPLIWDRISELADIVKILRKEVEDSTSYGLVMSATRVSGLTDHEGLNQFIANIKVHDKELYRIGELKVSSIARLKQPLCVEGYCFSERYLKEFKEVLRDLGVKKLVQRLLRDILVLEFQYKGKAYYYLQAPIVES